MNRNLGVRSDVESETIDDQPDHSQTSVSVTYAYDAPPADQPQAPEPNAEGEPITAKHLAIWDMFTGLF